MKFIEYNPISEKGGCILRTFMKLLDKSCLELKQELEELAKEMDYNSYKETEVFEKYLSINNFIKIDGSKTLIKDLELQNGKYAIFCFKDDYYHMVAIIDGVVYDKTDKCFDLYAINIYRLNE